MTPTSTEPGRRTLPSRDDDWHSCTLSRLADHLERDVYAATRAAADRARDGVREEDAPVRKLSAALEAHLRECAESTFPRVRSLENARLGLGAWPDPSLPPLRRRLETAVTRGKDLRARLAELRARSDESLARALGRLEAALDRQLSLEAILFTRAADLEPVDLPPPYAS